MHWLLPLYDPLVAFCTRESSSKQRLLEQIQLESNQRIIDFGCGSGTLLAAMANRAKNQGLEGFRLTGVDADQRILQQAGAKLSKNAARSAAQIELLCHHGPGLPLESSIFDACTCSLVFHHLTREQKRDTLLELRRILRPGSPFFLMDYGRATNTFAAMCFLIVRTFDGWKQTADNSAGNLPALLEDAGFEDVRELFRLQTPLGTLYTWQATA